MAQSHLLKKQNGIAVLTIVLIVSAVGIFFLFQVMSIYSKNQNLFVKEKDGLLLNEATMSTFAVMEVGLQGIDSFQREFSEGSSFSC
jgi:NADH:ubiquinone oxidoreductase subunit 6 (subunit J)